MISELMSNPSSKLFHRIVRRNRSENTSTCTQYIKYNGKELYEPSEQIVVFKEFYKDLAMPKAEPHFDQDYADEISIKYQHIKILCKEARNKTEVFNETDIQKAISKLNSGKSADEFGIQAKHLKSAGCHVLPLLFLF